ncbi:hypothetical protein TBLA_0A06530 [Henningerozyma blattae CBS 6284]|uniref:TLDc domain-containing protein n=1 Tax=Henningerozyma blattae (strain ATCC 34711 / CBS 6284 / DSM 70876 / NBRC 10599 / NRRL Y-10934 / UCD 77-7) TaxID=1071380 RepID=I2GWE3_HENB6|nr:hypothetical protein TBLA_0A06530 [Tetrapisispora blattae CBS 6284]CCH58445.1 hypothetical protein TBLA_0A06530 [Tetrapisispora blattae CBS 6284]
MGQKYSSTETLPLPKNPNTLIKEIFTVSELITFQKRINRSLDDIISDKEIIKFSYIPDSKPHLQHLYLRFIRNLNKYPSNDNIITGYSYLKIITLLNKKRRNKMFPKIEWIKIIFMCLSDEEVQFPCWETTHDIHVLENDLIEFISLLLTLNMNCCTDYCLINQDLTFNDHDWDTYWRKSASCIVRDMKECNVEEFENVLLIVPNIFDCLKNLIEHSLYTKDQLKECPLGPSQFTKTKMNQAILCQILLSMRKRSMDISKLYIGRENGYSMRSFQSKVFKWKAPTILLITGKKIINDQEYSEKNNRYKSFLNSYPRLKDGKTTFQTPLHYTFAIYIEEPWKMTKGYFGGLHTKIIQLSPRQDVFTCTDPNAVYFHTQNGIGIGNEHMSSDNKYKPGNVSITIDSTLEFAVFRHSGPGVFKTGIIANQEIFEIRLHIQSVEVWGCGGAKELAEQKHEWEWEEREAQRRQHVSMHVTEDRALLELAGIIGERPV